MSPEAEATEWLERLTADELRALFTAIAWSPDLPRDVRASAYQCARAVDRLEAELRELGSAPPGEAL